MPPKKGGGGANPVPTAGAVNKGPTQRSNESSLGRNPLGQISKSNSGIAPLIIEGANLSKMQVSDLIKQQLKDICILDIQLSRSGMFTVYAKDVKSFNRILNEFAGILATKGQASAKVYVPRSIQRIKDTEKVAFVKRVDLEVPEGRITEALKDVGLEVIEVARLMKRDRTAPTQTVKITFSDVKNRNTFVQTGLQVDSMHFIAEAANHNTKPVQCYLCLQYNHIAKYCKTKQQLCAKCGDNHHVDKCTAATDAQKCVNCEGKHSATSNECPKYKEQEKRLLNAVKQYGSSATQTTQQTYNINNTNDFPTLPPNTQMNLLQADMFDKLFEMFSNKMEKMIEATTSRLINSLQQRISKIEKIVKIVEENVGNDAVDAYSVSSSDSDNDTVQRSQQPKRTLPIQRTGSLPSSAATPKTTTEITSKTSNKKKTAPATNAKRNRSPNSSLDATATKNKDRKTSDNEN